MFAEHGMEDGMTSGDRRKKSQAKALKAMTGRSYSSVRSQTDARPIPDLTQQERLGRLSHLYGKTYAEICLNLENYGLVEGVRRIFDSGILPCRKNAGEGTQCFVLDEEVLERMPSVDVWILLAGSGSSLPEMPEDVPESVRLEAKAAFEVVEAFRENRLGALVGWTDLQINARRGDGLLMILREAVFLRQTELVRPDFVTSGAGQPDPPSEPLRINLDGSGLASLKKEIERNVQVRGVLAREIQGKLPPPIKGTSARNPQRIWLSRDQESNRVFWLREPGGKWLRKVHTNPELSERIAMDFLMDSFAFSYLVDSSEPPDSGFAALPNLKGCSLILLREDAEGSRSTVWKPVVGEDGSTGYWSPSHLAAKFLTGMDIPEKNYVRGDHLLGNPEEQDQAILALLRMITDMEVAVSRGESFDLGPTLAEVKALVDSSDAKRELGH